MNALNESAGELLSLLWASAWQAALLACVIAVVLYALRRRMTSQWRYALLCLLLIKFAMPPFLTLPTGLFSAAVGLVPQPVPEIIPIEVAATPIGQEGASLRKPNSQQLSKSNDVSLGDSKDSVINADRKPGIQQSPSFVKDSWPALVATIYLLGVCWTFFLLIRCHRRVHCLVSSSQCCDDESLEMTFANVCQSLQLRRQPQLLISDKTDAPIATGAVRPKVVMPRVMMEQLDGDQLEIIFAHEAAHIKRRDLLVGWLEAVLSVVWWFHPVMWWLRGSLRRTREECCDDLLVSRRLAEPVRYCETIIYAARCQTHRVAEPVALGFASGEHPTAGRIRRLMDSSLKRARGMKKSALVVVALLGLVLLPGMRPESAPVKKTTLNGLFGGWRNLPFELEAAEEKAVRDCVEIAQTYFHTRNDKRLFDDINTKTALESVLEKHPQLFYAQYLLGTWHRNNGNEERGRRLLNRSMKNAPVVLMRRYVGGDGSPISGVKIRRQELECNRVKNGSIDPSLKLIYVGLETDADGTIHLPAYDTVFRLSGNYPDGHSVDYESLGWFESKSKTGVLPAVLAWQTYSRPTNFERTAAQSARLKKARAAADSRIKIGDNEFVLSEIARPDQNGQWMFEDGRGNPMPSKRSLNPLKNAAYMDHVFAYLTSPDAESFDVHNVVVLDSRTKIELSSFQSGAGVRRSHPSQIHAYSLWDKLPDTIDLLMEIASFPKPTVMTHVEAKTGASAQHLDVTLEIQYLAAGNHHGWSSNKGFHGEPNEISTTSEIILALRGNRARRTLVRAVRTDGSYYPLKNFGWFSAATMDGPIRMHLPLEEIDHFEITPYVEPVSIYFEKIQLPKRAGQLADVPPIDFLIDGVPRQHVSDALSPVRIRFESLRGRAYSGVGGNQHGITLNETDPADLKPNTMSTVTWRIDGSAAFDVESEFVVGIEAAAPGNLGRRSSMSVWGGREYAGVDARQVPLQTVRAARIYLSPKPVP